MSNDWYSDIVDFHREVMVDDSADDKKPHIPNRKHRALRHELITEEVDELLIALYNDDLVKIADGIADSIVVLLGTAVTYGIDIRPVWEEVHKTNMAKKTGPLREDGKRLKPEGWIPPDIAGIIEAQKS